MSDLPDNGRDTEQDDALLKRLLTLAGPRATVPSEVQDRVYRNVLAAWEDSVAGPDTDQAYARVHDAWSRRENRTKARRWMFWPVAIAATMLLAVFLTSLPGSPPDDAATIASDRLGVVDRVIGMDTLTLPEGGSLLAGTVLQTGAGEGLGLIMAGGESVRIDENSQVRIETQNRLTLLRGRVYADSGETSYRRGSLVVETTYGRVTDIGTQFAVGLLPAGLDVAVREGRVDIHDGQIAHKAIAGERLELAAGQPAVVSSIAPNDATWHWTAKLAPSFDIDGRSLFDFLRWAAREAGLELVFASDEIAVGAMRVDLHGSIAGQSPVEAIESVLIGTRFKYVIEGGQVLVTQ